MSETQRPLGGDFDRKAETWDKADQHRARSRAVAEKMRAMLPALKGLHALEFGAGTGLLSMELLADLGSLVAIDTSEGMLDAFRQKTRGMPSVKILAHDLSRDDLHEGPFDLVYSVMTLHHVERVEEVLRRCRGLLRPGGHVAIADLEEEDGSFHENPGSFVHAGFSPERLAGLLARAGFCDVRHERAYTMTKTVTGETRQYPVFLIVARACVSAGRSARGV